jgi:CheY-like chemotaxis protein
MHVGQQTAAGRGERQAPPPPAVHGVGPQSSGLIDAESDAGMGTRVAVGLPAAGATGKASEQRPEPAPAEPETILLVEDEDSVRALVRTVLQRQGYRLLDAGSPAAARRLFEAHASGIDLLITDVVMPGMTGPELAKLFLVVRPDLNVLFMSGYADAGVPDGPRGERVDFLSKPFRTAVLVDKVREILSRSERECS